MMSLLGIFFYILYKNNVKRVFIVMGYTFSQDKFEKNIDFRFCYLICFFCLILLSLYVVELQSINNYGSKK